MPRKRAAQAQSQRTPRTPKRAKTTNGTSSHFSGGGTPSDLAATPAKIRKLEGNDSHNNVHKLPTPETSITSQDTDTDTELTDLEELEAKLHTPSGPPRNTPSRILRKKGTTILENDVRVRFSFPDPTTDQTIELGLSTLEQISAKLHNNSRRSEKPHPKGTPLVWSESRRELCESLPWYRSYKGGGYISDGIAHAFMFDSQAHARDYIDSTVVIARAGGGMAKDPDDKTGAMSLSRDQEATAQVKALEGNMREYRPVGVIAGQFLSCMQSQMKHRYQFLDWFKPTDIWCEKTNGFVCVRYRFEKLRPWEPSWWTPAGEEDEIEELTDDLDVLVPLSHKCSFCGKTSMQVYLNGPMCLHPACQRFWTLPSGEEPGDQLKYDPRFLKRRAKWPHSSVPWITKPDPLNFSGELTNIEGDIEQEDLPELTKSMVCPKCGRCTAAKYWTYWLCGNAKCGLRKTLPRPTFSKAMIRDPLHPVTDDYSFSRDWQDSSIAMEVLFLGNYRVHKYYFPGLEDTFVAHLIANKTICEEENGPDDMFRDLLNEEIGLERRPKDDARLSGENLCDHFTKNFGMSYKFVASPDSESFECSPRAVKMARSIMIDCAKKLGITNEEDFNECMLLGYKTLNKIGFHDDGETGLGPTVATLSVGCVAEMRIKMQEKYYKGYTNAGSVDSLPPIPGGINYPERKEAYNELKKLKESGNQAAYTAKRRSLPKELGLDKAKQKSAPEVLKLKLYHGDVVVMHGDLLQSYYLHCVEPKAKRRFAFTCRDILENHLKEEEKPGYEVTKDEIGYDTERLPKPGEGRMK